MPDEPAGTTGGPDVAALGPPPGVGEPPPLAPAPPSRRRRWVRRIATGLLVLLAVAAIAGLFIHLPYRIISPGSATPLDQDVVSVRGASTFPHRGRLLYLTVRVTPSDPNVYRYLFAHLDSDVQIIGRSDFQGCASDAENLRISNLEMRDSQDTAKTVALRRLGYTVPDEKSETTIVDVVCNGPSAGKLQLGDIITAVDGHPVTVAADIKPLIVAHRPGDRIQVTVDRDGVKKDVTVKAGERDHQAFLGVSSSDVAEHHFPIDVNIDTARVSGPSAGLAFTLAIIDDLTPGDLTGGQRVAITGTIAPDGTVGPVGGVAQKAVAARSAGAKLMLVPPEEFKDAKSHADGMKVVSVRTLDDALTALRKAGGDPIGATPTTAAPIAGPNGPPQ
jgi:PDZ domain-containing protein